MFLTCAATEPLTVELGRDLSIDVRAARRA